MADGDTLNIPPRYPDKGLDPKPQSQDVPKKDDENKTFDEQLSDLKTEYQEKLQEIFEKHLGARLKEGEYHEIKKIQGVQENALRAMFEDYETIHQQALAASAQARQKFFQQEIEPLVPKQLPPKPESASKKITPEEEEMLQEARQEAENRLVYIEAILETTLKNQYIQGDEIIPFHNFLLNIEHVTGKDPELLALMKKLRDKKQLTPEDYNLIVARLEPDNVAQSVNPYAGIEVHNVPEDLKDLPEKERIGSNNLGMILAMLNPGQRYEFIEQLMNSEQKEHTAEVLESMMTSGLLSSMQGQELTFMALSRDDLSRVERERFEDILDTIDAGFYQEQAERLRKAIQEESAKRNDQMFAVNPLERFLGGPFWATLMKIHSGLWLFANVLHNHADLKEKGGWARLATNPYVLGAIAEYGIAHELETGGRKVGMGFGHGSVAEWFERLGDDGPNGEEEEQFYTIFYEAYTQSPSLGLFLEKGGGDVVMGAYKAKEDQYDKESEGEGRDEKLRTFTLEDVFAFLAQSKNDSHKDELFALLEDAEQQYAGTEKFIARFPQIHEAMGFRNNADVQEKLAGIRDAQKVKEPYNPAPQHLPDVSAGFEADDLSIPARPAGDDENVTALPS